MKKSLGARTLLAAVPVLVVGSYDDELQPNLMTCAWGGICCSEPPCVNIAIRKGRYSYQNIISHKAFTVNVLFSKQIKEADFYGIASGRNHRKFAMTGITPIKSDVVDAPYGKEFPMVLECKLLHQIDIGVHTEFVGEILDVKVEDNLLDKNGNMVGSKLDPILYIPEIREYYALGKYLGKGYSLGKKFIDYH